MVLDVITFQKIFFVICLEQPITINQIYNEARGLCCLTKEPSGLQPSGLLVTLVQANKALSKVFCSLNKSHAHGIPKGELGEWPYHHDPTLL